MRPSVLLADEMTGNLDSENGRKVIDLVLELNRNLGIAVLAVTHDSSVAKRMQQIFVMKDGILQATS